jgi:hypothetical protein
MLFITKVSYRLTLGAIIFTAICSAEAIPEVTIEYTNSTDPTSNPNGVHGNKANTADLYGLGVRVGFYLQAVSFVIGFGNTLRLEAKSQFAGVILAFALLARWFTRLHEHSISASELWVSLALVLCITTPGMWLLLFTLETQRRKYLQRYRNTTATFAKITEGQTLNILQALTVFIWTTIANSFYSYHIIGAQKGETYPAAPGTRNVVWMFTTQNIDSTWIKTFMLGQAIFATILTFLPTFAYSIAAAYSFYLYWNPLTEPREVKLNPEDIRREVKIALERKRFHVTAGFIFLAYSTLLIISIERTINEAGLTPEDNLAGPGQLLPLIVGIISLVSSLADLWSRNKPTERGEAPPIGPWAFHLSDLRNEQYKQVPANWEHEWGDGRQ